MKKILYTIAVMLALAIGSGLLVIYSGTYDVSASREESGLIRWALSTTRQVYVEQQAEAITPPDNASTPNPEVLRSGFNHYDEMCVGCHLAPGKATSEIRQGLNPQPPQLAKRARRRTLEEIFWVTKHGIKMTGMPAWGATHDDMQLWAIAAFVKQLPELSAEQYQAMKQQPVDDGHHHDDHSH